MQTRIGVEHSSPTCLVKYGLFYSCENLLLSGSDVSADTSDPDNNKPIYKRLKTLYTAIGICHADYMVCLLARSGRPR